jgi:DNA polymerase (family 10)
VNETIKEVAGLRLPVKNDEVAWLLHEIGDMLDILGEDGFRVVSYHRAARAVEGLTEDIGDLVRDGKLGNIPGVGSAIAEKITECVTTGRLGYHEELRARIPPGVLELLQVRGIGPKKVQVLWQQLGITDLATLEQAAKHRRLRRIKGFGEKTETNLLKAIETYRQGQSRALIWDAAQIVDAIRVHLESHARITRLEAAGSFRRMRETVGDVDILVTTPEVKAALRAFTTFPAVKQVYSEGEIKSSVLVEFSAYGDGTRLLQVDLEVLDAESWGAGLQYFTGSKDHNVHLRGMAVERGLKLNEYGLFRGEEKLAGASEEDVYRGLGLPWIPPELREDRGEIEAALRSELPRLVELGDIRGDFHVHTNATDGTESLEAMVQAARARGYEYVGISDHSPSEVVAFGLTSEQALAQRDRIRELNRDLKDFTVLVGTECDILEGGAMDYPDEVLRELDYVLAAVHSKFTMPRKEMTARLIAAVENPYVSVLAHPMARLIGARDSVDVDFDEVFAACAKTGTAVEVNAGPTRMDLTGPQARAAKSAGCALAVDTDAHASGELAAMRFGVGSARRGWLTSADVVNAWPVDRVMAFFR